MYAGTCRPTALTCPALPRPAGEVAPAVGLKVRATLITHGYQEIRPLFVSLGLLR
jgi:hypothetical protein